MPADFCFVVHAAEGDADELPVHSACDGAAEGRFADTRGTDKAENRAFQFWRELAFVAIVTLRAPRFEHPHGEVFDNPFFHLL